MTYINKRHIDGSAIVEFHLFYDGPLDMQIWSLLSRSQCRNSVTQVTDKAHGSLVFIVETKHVYLILMFNTSLYVSFEQKRVLNISFTWSMHSIRKPALKSLLIFCASFISINYLIDILFNYAAKEHAYCIIKNLWIKCNNKSVLNFEFFGFSPNKKEL